MAYKNIIYEKTGRIARVTLNRPDNMNALSEELEVEMYGALTDAGKDPKIRVAIIKGSGRAFSAGGALGGGGAPRTQMQSRQAIEDRRHRLLTLWDLPIPTIAQVHGYCLARGSVLALTCDLTIAAEDAHFGGAQAPLGAGNVAPIWIWNIGTKKAKEYFFPIGKLLDGKEAERIGLINRAVPADRLEAEVNETAEQIAKTPREMLTLQKLVANRSAEIMGLRAIWFTGVDLDGLTVGTEAVKKFQARMKEVGVSTAMKEWRTGQGPLADL